MKKFEKYAEEIPDETKLILASLDNPVRQAILVLLNKRGELPFSDIQRELGLNKLTLNFHLKKLFSSALVDHYFKHEFGVQRYSYYSVTSLGNRVLSNLNKALIPPPPFQKLKALQTFTERYSLFPYGFTNCPPSYLSGKEKKAVVVIAPSCVQTSSPESSTSLVGYTRTE